MEPYTFFEHTADIGVEAYGRDLPELFENAALAMAEIICDPKTVEPLETKKVEVEAEDKESLLVGWLNEIIYLIEAENLLFSRFEVRSLNDNELRAEVTGEPIGEEKHEIKTEIKAATYHELKIDRQGSGWLARVIFDI